MVSTSRSIRLRRVLVGMVGEMCGGPGVVEMLVMMRVR
jgi:hypothetical protein